MIELLERLAESDALKEETNALMTEIVSHYKDENSKFGMALRKTIQAIKDPAHKMWDGVPLMERKAIGMVVKDIERKLARES